ncbi:MAG TPA: FadR/GntR family transcriptional regulator [Capsulimonadaceae bacterium]|jgi:DNA-binding FadR family transcriptional regulator
MNSSLPTSGTLRTIQRRQLVDQVLASLRGKIAAGEFPLGGKLPPEPVLMEQLAVGRSTVREAVRVLAHAGLLEVRQGDGTYVRATHNEESLSNKLRDARVIEVQEVRHALELETARLAALRRDDRDIATLRSLLQLREDARLRRDSAELVRVDVEFHVAVAAATKNTLLAELYRSFAGVVQSSLSSYATFSEAQASYHQQLFDAIEARDAVAANKASAFLLESANAPRVA